MLTLCVLLAADCIGTTALRWMIPARLGMGWQPLGNFAFRVTVVPGSPAARAGLRTGDVIDSRRLSPAERWRWNDTNSIYPGERFQAVVVRPNGARPVTIVAAAAPLNPISFYLQFAAEFAMLWMLGFAAFVTARGADDRRHRLIAAFLVALVFDGKLAETTTFLTSIPSLDFVLSLVSSLFDFGANLLFLMFVQTFGAGGSIGRRSSEVLFVIAAAIDAFGAIAQSASYFAGWYDPSPAAGRMFDLVSGGVFIVAAVVLIVSALRETTGDERNRLAWSTVPWSFFIVFDIGMHLLGEVFPSIEDSKIDWIVGNTAFFMAPVALTYALFARRILDVGFTLNRAALFAATSLVIAGTFAGLQWLADTLLSRILHVRSLVSEALIVVAVYYLVRLVRRNIDAAVTHMLFAARERRLDALRATTRALDEIDEPDAFGSFIVAELGAKADIAATVYLEDRDGTFVPVAGGGEARRPVQRTDPALIALRAQREPTDAAAFGEPQGMVFPMLVRGRLRGLLICASRDATELAPDEVRLLTTLADRAASNRDDVLAQALQREVSSLRDENERLLRLVAAEGRLSHGST